MVAVEAAPNTRIIQSILANTIDLGIVTQPSSSSELEYESLGTDSLCLVLPSDYLSQSITFDSLEGVGFIDHPDGGHYAEDQQQAPGPRRDPRGRCRDRADQPDLNTRLGRSWLHSITGNGCSSFSSKIITPYRRVESANL